MVVKISTVARNRAGAVITQLIDQGSINDNGKLEIRSGVRPLSPQAPATGTVLVSAFLPSPAFREFVNGTARANAIEGSLPILATVQATWFRIYDRDNIPVLDGDVSKSGVDGDLVLDYVNFTAGGVVIINNLFATMPE